MQDNYAGDVGDFGKFGLLRSLAGKGLTIGVNWYKVVPNIPSAHGDGRYRIPAHFFGCDNALAENLYRISCANDRSISMLMQENLISHAVYFDTPVNDCNRFAWHKKALGTLATCDTVFLDPDNGLMPSSVKKTFRNNEKYVIDEEIRDYISCGQSVILYNHRPRKRAEVYFPEVWQRLAAIQGVHPAYISYLTFPRFSVRDYFMIATDDDHRRIFQDTVAEMLASVWGQTGMCRLEKKTMQMK